MHALKVELRIPQRTRNAFFLAALLIFLVAGDARAAAEFSFRTDILPILSKAGCNAGACHGTTTGQGGFRLSLLGYDPEEDFWTITREFQGRRLNVDEPEASLLLRKATHSIDHEGGRRLRRNSEEYRALVDWIRKGAPFGARDLRITGIAVEPADQLLESVGEQVQLRVLASFPDGSSRDVTGHSLYNSNDEGIAEVDGQGLVTIRSRGVVSIMVRFGGQVAAARLAVPFGGAQIKPREFEPSNFIDNEILAELSRLRVSPAGLSDDSEFIRRVYLDLAGQLPPPGAVRDFLASGPSADKRKKVIDELLSREAFIDYWTLKFADLLLIGGRKGNEAGTRIYHDWLREQIAENEPWDTIAKELLVAKGTITKSGPPNFYTLATDPRDLAEYAGSMFLGIRIGCARCHAHPSDRWTQDDYYEFSAFFARVARNGNDITVKAGGELEYPKSRKPVSPRPLGGELVNLEAGAGGEMDRRAILAGSIIQNPLFAQAIVNRVWKELLGRGLVEPADDLRPTNPASHPALLDRLASEFRKHNFDLRWLIGSIASSRTYQLASRGDMDAPAGNALFARAEWKPLPARVFMDAISDVTGVTEQFDGAEPGARAVQLIGAQTPSYALDVLGRCSRERICESSSAGGGLAQALHLINGSTINNKLHSGVLRHLKQQGRTDQEIVDELYLRALTRSPEQREMDYWTGILSEADNRDAALEDFLWTLLNCREFAYNH